MNKRLLIGTGMVILLFAVFNPTVFANGKQGIAHLVMEHGEKIKQLEQIVKDLNENNDSRESAILSQEGKEALEAEIKYYLDDFKFQWANDESGEGKQVIINITDSQLVESDGKIVLKIFTEGDYDWTAVKVERGSNFGEGRSFAQNFIFNFHPIPLMYGVELNYEFYQNGERVTVFR